VGAAASGSASPGCGVTDPDTAVFQHRVAGIALAACRDQGFALAGGQALIAHGIVNRATEDIDIFTNNTAGVRRASAVVAGALTSAGYTVESVSEMTELDERFSGFGDDLAELEISDGGHIVRLQLARFDRHRTPVVMEIGPVLHADDVLGSKVAALATRAEPRDYIDVAAALRVRSAEELRRLAALADPAITQDDLSLAMARLDRLDDSVFTELYGLSKKQTDTLRASFADWPRV
jgi:predicted nucleotidyltransferase component of viral defense system